LLKRTESGIEKAARVSKKSGAKKSCYAEAKETVSSSRIELTPEDKLIADNFKANRKPSLACRERIYIIRRSGTPYLQHAGNQ
jgi:hypothetical protein